MGATMKPLCKNVGGKAQLLDQLLVHVPEKFEGYCEPFVGGGALFWKLATLGRLQGKRVVLCDKNKILIDLYREVRDDPEYLIGYLGRMRDLYEENAEGLYYQVRDAWNSGVQTPGMLLFLRQTAFNGLFRYSKKGRLNSSWGFYKNPKLCDPENLRACSRALEDVELCDGDTLDWLDVPMPRRNWLYYLDPPYHGTFDGYDSDGFGPVAQQGLIKRAGDLTELGAHVLYSNAQSKEVSSWIAEFWPQAAIYEVLGRDSINRDGSGRGKRPELLAVGTPSLT
jgi:DNA adenine methylase